MVLWLKRSFWAILGLPRCDQLTALISNSMDRELAFGERLLLRFHLFICGRCRRYQEHLELIRCSARRRDREEVLIDACLSVESRSRMKQLLSRHRE
ncbi:MAG TPA: zf-HC2 domain-containing protein [Candidatus Angelobacter sp.]|nr:zf-HC2 domain-containing protein [Candidatus Angelobacter sp.]